MKICEEQLDVIHACQLVQFNYIYKELQCTFFLCFVSAKFLKLEQLDQDPGVPPDTTGVSVDRTGQVGTYFYTAPEIEQGWPKIDEKVNDWIDYVAFFSCP